jgi:hypothetical protein
MTVRELIAKLETLDPELPVARFEGFRTTPVHLASVTMQYDENDRKLERIVVIG